jgi:hypothetical protein
VEALLGRCGRGYDDPLAPFFKRDHPRGLHCLTFTEGEADAYVYFDEDWRVAIVAVTRLLGCHPSPASAPGSAGDAC